VLGVDAVVRSDDPSLEMREYAVDARLPFGVVEPVGIV
jgi:hypothetical protein